MTPKFKVGDIVKWDATKMSFPKKRIEGLGKVVQVFEALGPMPTNYSIEGNWRVVFEHELTLDEGAA